MNQPAPPRCQVASGSLEAPGLTLALCGEDSLQVRKERLAMVEVERQVWSSPRRGAVLSVLAAFL